MFASLVPDTTPAVEKGSKMGKRYATKAKALSPEQDATKCWACRTARSSWQC